MRPVFFSACALWLTIWLGTARPVAAENSATMGYPEVLFQGYYLVDSEYLPQIKQKLATLVEQGGQSQFSLLVAPGLRLQAGGGYGTVQQKNELIGDHDFALKRKIFSAGFSLVQSKSFSSQGILALECFSNDGQKGYYRLQDDENLVTGSLNLTWKSEPWRLAGKYYRSRETDPFYDMTDQRAVLMLKTRNLTGVEIGYQFDPAWETAVSLYYEDYGTTQKDQLNVNAQIAFQTEYLVLSRVAAGAGYYLEEEETILNLTLNGGYTATKPLTLGWSGEIEWADIDASVLVGGNLWFRVNLSAQTALNLQLQAEKEMGDDQDSLLAASLSLTVSF